MRTLNPYAVYTRAAAAVAIPAGGWWLLYSEFADVLLLQISEFRFGWLYTAIAVCVLIGIELRCLGTLYHLVLSGGQVEVFHARRTNPDRITRRRRRRLCAATAGMAMGIAFLAAEIGFRVFDIRPPASGQPSVADYLAVNNSLNAWGLREPWDSLPEKDHRLRIAFLGDSIVYGDGVEREATFCHLLEGLLASSRPEGVRTINMGFWGSAPGWQLEQFLSLRNVIRPDVVVQVVYPNDLEIYMHRRLDEIYRIRDDALWVGEWSYVLRYAERTIRYWAAWKRTIDYFRGGQTPEQRRRAWTKFKRDVRACKDAVEESGAKYALVLFPWLVRLDGYDLGDVHDAMRKFAMELGTPYLDLLEVFAGRDAEKLRVSLVNEHPNALGHRIAAERISGFLRDEVLPSLNR